MQRIYNPSSFSKTLLFSLILASFTLLAIPAFADVPITITQQGRLLEDDATPMTGSQDLLFEVYDSASGGELLWSDTVTTTLDENGVYTAILDGIDSTILQDAEAYLALTVDQEEFSPRLELTSVPFAALAQEAFSVADGSITSDAFAPGAVTSEAIDSVSWDQLSDVPSGITDSTDTLAGLECSSGQLAIYDGSAWGCAAPQDTTYTAGDGLVESGQQFSIDLPFLQERFFEIPDGDYFDIEQGIRTQDSIHVNSGNTNSFAGIYFDGDNLSDAAAYLVHYPSQNNIALRGQDNVYFGNITNSTDLRNFGRIRAGASGGNTAHAPLHARADQFSTALLLEHRTDSSGWVMGPGDSSQNLNFYQLDNVGTQTANSSGTLRSRIDSDTGAYSTASDQRLKRDIDYLDGILPGVMQLNAAQYRFKSAGANSNQTVGFMAQDVQKVFPELVQYYKETDMYGLSYSQFGVLAIQAIQEQQQIIDTKTAEINALENRLDSMEQRLNNLEASR